MLKINGLSKLVDFFETKTFPIEEKILKTTIQVGPVRYRKCAFLFIDNEGIYLKIKMIFKNYPPVFIPWTSIKENKKSSLYGLQAIQLDFNDVSLPSIKLYETDFAKHAQYLN